MTLHQRIVSIFVLLGLVLVVQSGNRLRFPDEVEYHQLALALAEREGFSLPNGQATAYRPPGYPFILSLLYRIHAAPLTGKLTNGLLLSLTAWGMCRIARNSLPALFLLAYPVLLYSAGLLYPQTLAGALLLLILLLLLRDLPSSRNLIPAGFLLGFLILCVPSFLLTAPVLAWILFRQVSGSFFHRSGKVTLLTLCTLLVVLPWTWRNYRKFDAFIMVSANSGLNLFLGNSPNAGPNTGVNVERSAELKAVEGMSEIDADTYYRDRALEWIGSHPREAARLYAAKALNYFNFRNELNTRSQSSRLKDLVMFCTWFPLLGIFVIRLFYFRKYPLRDLEKAIYLLVITNVFLSAVFFTRIRFRLPFDLLMILSNALFISRLPALSRFFSDKPLTNEEIHL